MSEHQATTEKKDGIIVRDEEGNMYYIRREILHLCKMRTKDFDTANFFPNKASSRRPDTKIIESSAEVIGSIKFDEDPMPEKAKKQVRTMDTNYTGDTYMCPW
jgi:hypothetical protein